MRKTTISFLKWNWQALASYFSVSLFCFPVCILPPPPSPDPFAAWFIFSTPLNGNAPNLHLLFPKISKVSSKIHFTFNGHVTIKIHQVHCVNSLGNGMKKKNRIKRNGPTTHFKASPSETLSRGPCDFWEWPILLPETCWNPLSSGHPLRIEAAAAFKSVYLAISSSISSVSPLCSSAGVCLSDRVWPHVSHSTTMSADRNRQAAWKTCLPQEASALTAPALQDHI